MFLFKSKEFDSGQFERDLKSITLKISRNEKGLRKYKSQKKRYQRMIPLYLSAAYTAYFSYVYKFGSLKTPRTIIFLALFPLLIGIIYYSVLSFFNYMINIKESSIEFWKAEHKEKLEMLKEKTNFEKTKELLARFSDGEDLKELEKEANEINQKKQEYLKLIQAGEKGKILEDLQNNSNTSIYDYFLTKLLGDNELGPDNRYALVCSKCFAHNGLAAPGTVATSVKYRCPHCGYMNGGTIIEEPVKNIDGAKSDSQAPE